MATLEEVLNGIDLPTPVPGGELLDSYARRCVFVGAHAALAWAQVHRPVAVVNAPVPETAQDGPQTEPGEDQPDQ